MTALVHPQAVAWPVPRTEATMRTRDQLLIGAAAGVGLAWGTRQVLRLSRRISLNDRVVIVTGASTGHGLLVAR